MRYFSEFRENARPLGAASLGLATGFSANSYTLSTIAPHMLKDLGWTKAEFAAASILGMLVMVFMPIVGRLADLIGARRTAAIGIVCLPLSFIAISFMTGDFRQYLAIYAFQSIFCITTTTTVYSRVVAGKFSIARGLALAIFASSPALLGAFASPLLTTFTLAFGWRASFRLLAILCFAFGCLTLLLIPASADQVGAPRTERRRVLHGYGPLLRSRAFWLLFIALLLCNMPQIIYLSQLNIMLIDRGLTAPTAAAMLSIFAVANVLGRFGCGLSLDRFPMHLVAAISMGVPAVGYFLLASGVTHLTAIEVSVFIMGLSIGAEGDLIGFLAARTFGMAVYSSAVGLLTAAIGGSAAIGAAILSLTLKNTGHFTLFLSVSAWCVLIGGFIFLLVGPGARHDAVHHGDAVPEPA